MASANCCMNCEKRHFKCHSTCEEYAEFLIQTAEKKEKISRYKNEYDEWNRYMHSSIERAKKKKRKEK